MAPQKGVVPKGLVPKEPVKVPKAIFKTLPKDIQQLLIKLNEAREAGDKEAQRKIRMALRKKGFYLSNIENGGGAPAKKENPKPKKEAISVDEDEDEEEVEEEEAEEEEEEEEEEAPEEDED